MRLATPWLNVTVKLAVKLELVAATVAGWPEARLTVALGAVVSIATARVPVLATLPAASVARAKTL